jgi:hypothetical protein
MPSVLDRPTDNSLYTKAQLFRLRRTMLRYCRSFPPGNERNQHRHVASSLRSLFKNKAWMDAHASER